MLGNLWKRLVGRSKEKARERADEVKGMSAAERRFVQKNAEDRQVDLSASEHLFEGGVSPHFDDGAPPRD
jgi:hypothetical protein